MDVTTSPGPEQLIDSLKRKGVTDERVLRAFREIHREDFVPRGAGGQVHEDWPIPIPHGQVTTQPSLIGMMVQALRLRPSDRVLEIGTGLGYQAAILSRLAREVVTIERLGDFVEEARGNFSKAKLENIRVIKGDGSIGAEDYAPFDAIIGAAATPRIPPSLSDQLEEGGQLVLPIGPGGNEDVWLFQKRGGQVEPISIIVPASFVRMVGREAHPE